MLPVSSGKQCWPWSPQLANASDGKMRAPRTSKSIAMVAIYTFMDLWKTGRVCLIILLKFLSSVKKGVRSETTFVSSQKREA
jgi:hypothetical protein